jgi:formylglycine-generating enzyme required for sulfatase activity
MPDMRVPFSLLTGLAFCLCTGVLADPPYYVRKDTWQDTLLASREALVKHEAEEASRPKPADDSGLQFGAWYQVGPFVAKKDAFAEVFPPEKKIDLAERYNDGKLKWAKHSEYADGIVQMLSAPSQAATYLYRVLTAAKPDTLTGYFGSDDGLTVWLNEEKIIANDVPRGPGPNQDAASLKLKQGENKLLLKISNHTGGHGFYFSTSDKPVQVDPKAQARGELWNLVRRDFAGEEARQQMAWEAEDALWSDDWQAGDFGALAKRYADRARIAPLAEEARRLLPAAKDSHGLKGVQVVYHRARRLDQVAARLADVNADALRRAVSDLTDTFADKYVHGPEYLTRLGALENQRTEILAAARGGDDAAVGRAEKLAAGLEKLRLEALLANPLLSFDKLLVVKRGAGNLGLPANWQGNSSLGKAGYDNELAVFSVLHPDAPLQTVFRPDGGKFVGDLDLHFNADKLLFSMPGDNGSWHVFEVGVDGQGLRQVSVGDQNDVDCFDPCYLPNGRIAFCSTACYQGVPCVGGSDAVSLLYDMDANGKDVRQLTFDQDHSWDPFVLNNGKVLYGRWEYSDTPHYFSRLLMSMNPDGTEQTNYYGSNSYWPNSLFYPRPVPNDPTKFVGIVSGHHGVRRMGELVLFDPALGRHEASGAVQQIPGYGKPVEPIIRDQLVDASWPKFLHPWPLSDKYFLASCQRTPDSPWGLYLVDVFDNMVPLRFERGYALLEPTPLQTRTQPPVIMDKVKPGQKDALVYVEDLYTGPGLKGVPKGSVKALRVFAFHFAYRNMGGHINVGIDGPWDVRRILGTVPVKEDGSALFRVPAKTPIAVQPLDAEGKAMQVMRSWMTAMPGETLSCVGCHESQNSVPHVRKASAALGDPVDITPWYGPARGFSFEREVQPVLDKYCVSCHVAAAKGVAAAAKAADGTVLPDLRGKQDRPDYKGAFTPSYEALHRYVRRPGPESDYHLLPPMEYHADTSELVQMLQKGHHGVALDHEAWDRLITWIDLNVPCLGAWHEERPIPNQGDERRRALTKLYANQEEDPEAVPEVKVTLEEATIGPIRLIGPIGPIGPIRLIRPIGPIKTGEDSATRVSAAASSTAREHAPTRAVELGNGLSLELALVPAGEFVMGDPDGCPDEQPLTRVRFDKPFWMGKVEVTNEQYALFDPAHDSRYISQTNKDQSTRGWPVNGPKQPVVRISWQQAMAFCRWLSEKTGQRFTLPTEAQWEYACRAGSATSLSYGDLDTDFSPFANLADASLRQYARANSPDWAPKDARFNDGGFVTRDVGSYRPNAWELHDMHGNAAEWTDTSYASYPSYPTHGQGGNATSRRVVRGGSWFDRPARCRSAFRLSYPAWEGVYNVGFRVVCESADATVEVARKPE